MCGTAISKLKISSEDFYNLTPIEFDYAITDYLKEKEHTERFELSKMRIQTFLLLNIQLDKESRFNTPEDMMPFNWEVGEVKEIPKLNETDWLKLDNTYCKN